MKKIEGRRNFIKTSMVLAATCAFPNIILANSKLSSYEKTLSFYNIHTGEHLKATFWTNGHYIQEELAQINHLLRDYRTGDIKPMDPHLLNLLCDIQETFGSKSAFHVISGYRSPKTNAYLRHASKGVAKHSLHMQARAIDINLPGIELASLRRTAMSLKKGGVGYYPKSDFVHVDTGRVRHW